MACSGNSKFQVVSLEKLHMGKIDAYSCKQADGQGVCTRWDTYMAKEISVRFRPEGRQVDPQYPLPGSPRLGRRPSAPAAPLQGSRRGRSGSEGPACPGPCRVAEAGATIFHATAETPQEAVRLAR